MVLRIAAYHRYYHAWHYGLLVSNGFRLAVIFVFAKAWWTEWKRRPAAKLWGLIATCLTTAALILSYFVLHHREIDRSEWEIGIFCIFLLIAYLWPEADNHPAIEEPDEETYRVPTD